MKLLVLGLILGSAGLGIVLPTKKCEAHKNAAVLHRSGRLNKRFRNVVSVPIS